MRRITSSRPSPAILVAVVALVAALAGTAVADPGAVASKITRSKVKTIAERKANKAIKQQAPNLQVGSATALTQLEYIRTNPVTVPAGANGSAIATCPAGKYATGGGGASQDVTSGGALTEVASHPSNGTQGQLGYTAWEYRVHNSSGAPHNINAYVICASLKAAQGQNVTPSNYTAGTAAP
jgi:hypothetical protein